MRYAYVVSSYNQQKFTFLLLMEWWVMRERGGAKGEKWVEGCSFRIASKKENEKAHSLTMIYVFSTTQSVQYTCCRSFFCVWALLVLWKITTKNKTFLMYTFYLLYTLCALCMCMATDGMVVNGWEITCFWPFSTWLK